MNGTTALSPWLPTAPCTPGHCAAHHPGSLHRREAERDRPAHPGSLHRREAEQDRPDHAGVVRAVVRLTAGLGTLLLGILLAPAAGLLPAATRLALVRHWTRAVVRAFGVRVRYEGTAAPAAGPLLVVANHVSWLDIPLIAAVLPGRMVAKSDVRHWPVLGTLAALGGTLFIDRDGIMALPGTVRTMAGVLAGGGRVIVFPEGSTWCGRERGRFRPAAFQAALDGGGAVQPVRIDYRPTDAAAYVADDPLGSSLWRVVTTRRLTAVVRLREPLPGGRYADRRALAAAAQRAVASDSANLPSLSVHQRSRSRPSSASSARTPA
ncbi:1-acyl-sn-glycerol-3-phosphate acyltransferase [Streptomyces venezuelae]|uniref:lysophospholipid acyltransferase family protein n=1 Tax=Streptomyces venezuelae TaxID=54571 RepID=UPI00123D566D|nr:lysophospholipid acyltransferase family protein [Streptomyces venezuelae]QES11460.1 1-acyl-sn-glycerol-3-phosphate acyltransferase [Streptomyces venezuelae]